MCNSTTNSTANYTKITIDGDLSLSSFIISVAGSNVNSATVECPISYKFQVTQNTGTLTIASKMKFLSGSSLTIAKDANCIINAGTVFYEGYTPKMVTGGSDFSPQNMGRAKFLVNGNLTINSNFGGIINSDSSTGTITTGENFVDYYETNEMLNSSDSSAWNKHIEYAEAYKLNNSIPSTFRLEKSKSYQLFANGNYWDVSGNTDISSFTLDNPSGKSSNKTAKSYTVTATYTYSNVTYSSINVSYRWVVSTSDFSSGTYTTIENPNSTMLTTNNNVATFTTPAATSASVYYKLTCTISFERKDTTKSNMSLTSGIYEAYYYESSGGCVLPTTLVLMADGSYKLAGMIEKGDRVISFNHETGKLEENVVIVTQLLQLAS